MNLLIVLISAATLALSMYLYRIATGEPVWRVNMLSLSFWSLLVTAFVSSVVVVLNVPFLGYDPANAAHFRGETDPRFRVWAVVMWMFVGIPLGGIVANALSKSKRSMREQMKEFRAAPVRSALDLRPDALYIVVLVCTVIVIGFNIAVMPKETALGAILSGAGVVQAEIVRRSADYESNVLVVSLLLNVGTMKLLSLMAFIAAYTTHRPRWWILFGMGFVASVFFAVSKGTVSDTVLYLVALGFARASLGGSFVRLRELVGGALVVALLFVVFKGAKGSLIHVLWTAVSSRLLFSQLLGTYIAFDTFPRHHAFIGFSSTGRIIHELFRLPTSDDYGLIMMRFYNWAGVEQGSAGHLTTIFMGEAWANFGWIGIVIAPLWVGGMVQALNRWMTRADRTVVRLAFYAYLAITFGYQRSFMEFYYPLGYASLVLGALALLYIVRFVLVTGSGVVPRSAPAVAEAES